MEDKIGYGGLKMSLLKTLDENQLNAIHLIISELAEKNEKLISPLGITTYEQLWGHIDSSLAQAKEGLGRDADKVIQEM